MGTIFFLNLFILLGLLSYSLLSKKFLLALYVVCYSVPFFGLVSCLWSDTVVLWPIGGFEYASDALIVYRLSIIWLLGGLGALLACVISSVLPEIKYSLFKGRVYSSVDFKSGSIFFFALALCLVFIRLIIPDGMANVFAGIESLVVLSIVAFCARALVYPSRRVFLVSFFLVLTYCIANAMTGDRDFIVLLVACMLGYFFRYQNSINTKVFFVAGFLLVCLLMIGVILSMYRMDVEISSDSFMQYFAYNSWNAIILPLVEQVSSRWDGSNMRYGQTYLDMMLSLGPSPIYTFFGLEKPISVDNPALWYYIFGLGGIHVAGVAFENFGLFGVFFNGFLSVCFLRIVDTRYCAGNFLHLFLYMLCSASVMHWVWYGEIYLLNSLVFYVMSLGLFSAMKVLRSFIFFGSSINIIER